ncbi:MAG: alpha-E domain-containing protein [Clostridia bacterium]
MGIISIEHSDRLLWLGRYTERVYTTMRLFAQTYDAMLDMDVRRYEEFCEKLDIPNIYDSKYDFCMRYCFDKNDVNSIFSNLIRAYDNAIVLREQLSSETLSYIQLAIYDMEKASMAKAPLVALQKVIDDVMAFWGMVDDATYNKNARNIIKTGKHIERLSLYARLHSDPELIFREIDRLIGRLGRTKLRYEQKSLENILEFTSQTEVDYGKIIFEVEHLI